MKVAVYAGTRNIYKDMLPSVKSLLIHSDVDKIYLLIEDDDFPYELPQEVECINVSHQAYFTADGPNFNTSWSYMILMRAALSKLFPQYDTILSLDVDTIINENISDLWNIDLTNYYLAAVPEPCKCKDNFTSINMGVALINLKKIRDNHKDDEIIKKLNEKEYDYPEQDCISELCQGFIYELNPEYNINNWADLEQVKHRKIHHFAAIKDWQDNPLVKRYSNISFTNIKRNQHFNFKLDVIIPAYNDVKGLERTLQSVYYPEHSDWVRVSVVNDASTESYKELEKKFPYVNFITLTTNGGPGRARNKGRKYTNYPYIMFVDCGDIIYSKWSFYEIFDTIVNYTMLDMYQWPWINGEWYTISADNSVCTPGLVYKREFLDDYNIWYCEEPAGSYSNEDIGFNHTCKAVIKNMELYDKSKHLQFFETPIYKMIYDRNSLTHKDNSYMIVKQIPGLVTNATHCIRQCEAVQLDEEVILEELNTFFVELYKNYLNCQKKKTPLLNEHFKTIQKFYNEVYKKYENEPRNEFYQSMVCGFRMKELLKLNVRPNIRRFINSLRENI